MIIIADKPGQLGNLLIVYANFLAFAREHSNRVSNPAFHAYASYFRNGGQAVGAIRYRLAYYTARVLNRLGLSNALAGATALDWHESMDLDDPAIVRQLPKFWFVQGWKYRANALLCKHQEYIRSHFEPAPVYLQRLNAWFSGSFPDPHEVRIGVHIRRGDYRHFEKGIYFYEITSYVRRMQQLEALFAGQRLHFLVCSNEALNAADFSALNSQVTFAPGHELLDLYSLARCHYMTGPPSTYTMWASFYGKVPLDMLHRMDQPVATHHFRIQETF